MIGGCWCRLVRALHSQSFCSPGAVAIVHGAETASPCLKSVLEGVRATMKSSDDESCKCLPHRCTPEGVVSLYGACRS